MAHQLTITDGFAVIRGEKPLPMEYNPYDMLLASLATCTLLVLQSYTQNHQIPLDEVDIHVEMEDTFAKHCDACISDPDARVTLIDMQLAFHGDQLDDAQRKRLHHVAEQCPIKKSLNSETLVRAEQVASVG